MKPLPPAAEVAADVLNPRWSERTQTAVIEADRAAVREEGADHALLLAAMVRGAVRWEPFVPHDGRGEIAVNGLRHVTRLNSAGCPELTPMLRAALEQPKEKADE